MLVIKPWTVFKAEFGHALDFSKAQVCQASAQLRLSFAVSPINICQTVCAQSINAPPHQHARREHSCLACSLPMTNSSASVSASLAGCGSSSSPAASPSCSCCLPSSRSAATARAPCATPLRKSSPLASSAPTLCLRFCPRSRARCSGPCRFSSSYSASTSFTKTTPRASWPPFAATMSFS